MNQILKIIQVPCGQLGIQTYGILSDLTPYTIESIFEEPNFYFIADREKNNCITQDQNGIRQLFEHWQALTVFNQLVQETAQTTPKPANEKLEPEKPEKEDLTGENLQNPVES